MSISSPPMLCQLCVFCCKPTVLKYWEESGNIVKKFLKFVGRLFGITSSSTITVLPLDSCEDCANLIDKFCQVYHQYKSLELQLLWNLDTLMNVMKMADKVPSRVKLLNKCSQDKDTVRVNWLKDFRQEVIEKCTHWITSGQPRVLLERDLPNFECEFHDDDDCGDDFVPLEIESEGFNGEPKQEVSLEATSENLTPGLPSVLEEPKPSMREIQLEFQGSDEIDVKYVPKNNAPIVKQKQFSDTKDRPFPCLQCERKFCTQKRLKNHEFLCGRKKNIRVKPFPCGICNTAYATYSGLRGHKRRAARTHKLIQKIALKKMNNNEMIKTEGVEPESGLNATGSKEVQIGKDSDSSQEVVEESHEQMDLKENGTLDIGVVCNAATTGYNLRGKRKMSYANQDDVADNDVLEEGHVDVDSTMHENYSSASSSETDKEENPKKKAKAYKLKQQPTSNAGEASDSDDDYNHVELKLRHGNRYFQCNLCSKSWNSFTSFRRHRCHTAKLEGLACPVNLCTKTFHTQKGLEVHKPLHGTFSCQFCDLVQEYAPDLATHESKQHVTRKISKKFECSRCAKGFRLINRYTTHFLNEHLGISDICSTCSICKYETSNESLKCHYHNYHDTKDLQPSQIQKCVHCPAYFRTLRQLIFHKNKMHDKVHDCSECGKSFSSSMRLKRHMNCLHPYHHENPDDPIPCDVAQCSKRFVSHQQLNYHKMYDHNKGFGEVKCRKCDRVFKTTPGMKLHMWSAHGNKEPQKNPCQKVVCNLGTCKMIFSKKKYLDEHQLLHNPGRYPCHFCDLVLDNILKLCMHEISKHPRKPDEPEAGLLYCPRCPFQTQSNPTYHNHFAAVHMGTGEVRSKTYRHLYGRFKCDICEVEMNFGPKLALHEAEHVAGPCNPSSSSDDIVATTTSTYSCSRCQKHFQKKSVYINHFLKTHLGVSDTHTCPICQHVSARTKRHYTIYHKTDGLDPSQISQCDQCPAYFIRGIQLIRHKDKMHEISLKCEECNKMYKSKKSLGDHMRIFHPLHDENPSLPFGCDLPNCKKRFATQPELDWHKQFRAHPKNPKSGTHDQLKCSECGKEFLNKYSLKVHMKTVHVDPTFICPECGKAYKTKSALETHMEYHRSPDSWKFQCDNCGKKCSTKYILQIHMRTHTNEKPYVCQYCGEKYAHQHNWRNHVLTKHKEEKDLTPKIKVTTSNRLSRKGTKKGDCITAGVSNH